MPFHDGLLGRNSVFESEKKLQTGKENDASQCIKKAIISDVPKDDVIIGAVPEIDEEIDHGGG